MLKSPGAAMFVIFLSTAIAPAADPGAPAAARQPEAPFARNVPEPPFVIDQAEKFAAIVPADARPAAVSKPVSLGEGPVWVGGDDGCLIFSSVEDNAILKWSATDGVTTFRKPSNRTNGNGLDAQCRLISCEMGGRRVVRGEPDGKITVLADKFDGKRLNSPNDLAVTSDGTIWFSDPPYGVTPKTKELSGKEQRALGQEGFTRLVREAYDRGIRYVDTADMYKMHGFVAAALKELPGKEIFVQTKTMAKTAEKAKADIERIRRELDRETLDTLLIHCMTKLNWPVDMRPVIDVFLEAKQKGQVRAIGVSCHSFDALTDAVGNDLMDVHLVRVNPFGRVMDADYEKVCQQIAAMHQKNRGVIGMKIYGNVGLKSREERFQSLKAVLGLGTVDAFTIGFSKIEHIDETLELIEKATAA